VLSAGKEHCLISFSHCNNSFSLSDDETVEVVPKKFSLAHSESLSGHCPDNDIDLNIAEKTSMNSFSAIAFQRINRRFSKHTLVARIECFNKLYAVPLPGGGGGGGGVIEPFVSAVYRLPLVSK